MKIRILPALLASLLFGACASTIQVVDSYTKKPVVGATVVAVNGNLSSAASLTNDNGVAVKPTLPNGERAFVISKPGYDTERVKVNP